MREDFGRRKSALVDAEHSHHAGAAVGRPVDFRARVELRDAARQSRQHRPGERALDGEAVEQPVLVEADHLHDRVDERPIAVQGKASIRLPRKLVDGPVEVRRRAAVESQLPLAGGEPPFGRRKIDVAQPDGALELDGTRAGSDHQRDMRLDGLRRVRQGAERVARHQEGDRLILALG